MPGSVFVWPAATSPQSIQSEGVYTLANADCVLHIY